MFLKVFAPLRVVNKILNSIQFEFGHKRNFLVSKGYFRAAKCHLAMGSIGNATNYLQKVLEKDPKNKDAQNDVSQWLVKK